MALVQYFEMDYIKFRNVTLTLLFLFLIGIAIYALYCKYQTHKKEKLERSIMINKMLINNSLPSNYSDVEPNSPNSHMPDYKIINDTIHGVPKRPQYLTGSMVVPAHNPQNTEEKKRTNAMIQYNLEYDNLVDDILDIVDAPKGLYIAP